MTTTNLRPLFEVAVTAHGQDALIRLREEISKFKRSEPLDPVTVIVPNNFVGIAARRALSSGDHGHIVAGQVGLVGVNFLNVLRLAELLGAPPLAQEGKRPVSTSLVAAAVRQVMAAEPGMFAPVAEHPTTERRLVDAHRELSAVGPEVLARLSTLSLRASDVVRIHQSVKSLLSPNWYSEDDLLVAACQAVKAQEPILASVGPVIVYLPEDMSTARATLLRALAADRQATLIAALTGVADADATLHLTAERLGVTMALDSTPSRTENILITSVSDADDEVRHVLRGIVAAARQGIRFDRMAVVFATDHPYGRLVHDHLTAADIPHNGSAVEGLGESAAGRLLRRLLSLSGRGFRRSDVGALLASSPLRWKGATVPSRAWDQISREAGVVKGAADWDQKLSAYSANRAAELDRLAGVPEYEWRERRLRRQIALSDDLRAFMQQLVSQLERGEYLVGWRERSRWCQRLLGTYTGDQRDWPEDQRRAAEQIEAVLDRLGGLDAVEPDPAAGVFLRTLDLELDGGLGRIGSFGNGVLVGPAWMCLGLELDRVWVLGMAEGSFPSRPREDSLLPDRERASAGGLALRGDRTGNEHRHFLAAVAATAPNGEAHLMRPRGDLRQSSERAPSRWLVGLAEDRTGARLAGAEIEVLDEPWLRHVASFAAGILDTEFPPTVQEFNARSLVDRLEVDGGVEGHPLMGHGRGLAAGVATQAARASDDFTRFDGNLEGLEIPDPASSGRATSATALETYARCPFQYFMRYMLGVDPLETPEHRIRIDPMSRGSVVHAVLDRFVGERVEAIEAGARSNSANWGWSGKDRERLHAIASEEFAEAHRLGLAGEALFWRRDQVLLRRDLDIFLELDTERRSSARLRPLATELGFGLGGSERVELALPDGKTVSIRGSIDVVDEDQDANLVVIDYKTGSETKVSEDDPHHGGTKLQLVLYAAAARAVLQRPLSEVTSLYWHLRARSKYCQVGYHVTTEIAIQTLSAVATIVENIGKGVFVHHPEETTRALWVSCHYCDPDGQGVSDARRRLIRKVGDPALADYLGLAEPSILPPSPLPDLLGGQT